jgi:hypothetical protein
MPSEPMIQSVPVAPPGYTLDPRKPWRRPVARADWRPWPIYFIWCALTCEISLLFLGSSPLRLPVRIATYGSSLVLLFLLRPRYAAHPALKLLKWVPIILCIGLVHPLRNTLGAGIGQVFLYIAIFSPVAWVAGCRPSEKVFRHVIMALWLFNVSSAGMGVLQVYFPETFKGTVSGVIAEKGTFQQGAANVKLANGTTVIRPLGLTDNPGGAATGGLYAIVLGVGVCLTDKRWLLRIIAGAGLLIGLFAIILSQVRVDLVMSIVCSLMLMVVLTRRGDWGRVISMSAVFGVVIMLGGAWAFAIGGKQTLERFSTLTSDDPTNVYQANRGMFINELIYDDIPRYPFGAGIGRWGMMNHYFGHEPDLYSEIMWTAWVLDGGIPLLVLYCGAFFIAIWVAWKIAATRKDNIGLWSGVVFSYNIAALAGTFVFPLFIVQTGLEFWLINACLFSASLEQAENMNT